ncbi:demethoxyubiquinone hydroxylase family protein [soil metagenome]
MSTPPPLAGHGAATRRLHEMLRVDHAGELGAVHIYRGQKAVFGQARGGETMAADMAEHEAGEQVHLSAFDAILTRRGVRPTVFAPLWRAAGFALGAGTALMGEKAAHACTEAVESVIEEHYAEQIADLSEREPELAAELARFRDDELEHRDHALAHGAREAPGYPVLSAVIKAGCRAAIRISEKL